MPPLVTLSALASALTTAQHAGHRLLVLAQGNAADCTKVVRRFLPQASLDTRVLWISAEAVADLPAGVTWLAPGQSQRQLGRNLGLVILDGHRGLRADDLGLVAGLIEGGGVLLLLWPEHAETPFQQWLQTGFDVHGSVCVDAAASLCAPWPWPHPGIPLPHRQEAITALNQEQATALNALLKMAYGRARRPLVLLADRGRGKTSLLGMAAAELLRGGKTRLVITGPRPEAVTTAFVHAQQHLPGSTIQGLCLDWQGRQLRYRAVDTLLEEPACELDVLFVDEAATLPVPLLQELCERYPRLALTSTVQGYEGTGRGFELRFQPWLAQHRPQYRRLTLKQPVRWSADDPLEALIDSSLLQAQLNLPAPDTRQARRLVWLQGDQLLRHRDWVSQAFTLLVNAHYQTSPNDLQRLLEDPAFGLLLALCLDHEGHEVVSGAVISVAEGPLAAALVAPVMAGRRRPPGSLIPQLLARATLEPNWLSYRGLRVVRIAVSPNHQGQGIGKALLTKLAQIAHAHGMDWLGSSFAATADIVHFWRRCGFVALHLGSQRDAASGCYSLIVVQHLTEAIAGLTQALQMRLGEELKTLLTELWPESEPELLQALIRGQNSAFDPRHSPWLEAFAQGSCTYEHALGSLKYLAWWRLEQPEPLRREETLCLRKLLWGWSWRALDRQAGLSQAAALSLLRQTCGEWQKKAGKAGLIRLGKDLGDNQP